MIVGVFFEDDELPDEDESQILEASRRFALSVHSRMKITILLSRF